MASRRVSVRPLSFGPQASASGFVRDPKPWFRGLMAVDPTSTSLNITGGMRAYAMDDPQVNSWEQLHYRQFKMLGKRLSFNVDLSGVGCGCCAALYLVAMPHAPSLGELVERPKERHRAHQSIRTGYCDIMGVGRSKPCTEIDLIEANVKGVQAAIHTRAAWVNDGVTCDQKGCVGGFGGNRTGQNGAKTYGRGGWIDTSHPFRVDASFSRRGKMRIVLSQASGI